MIVNTSVTLMINQVWDIVFAAQSRSFEQIRVNATAASVDIAARDVIERAGYGHAFTHRVGHGIGIKGQSSVNIQSRCAQ